MSPISSAPQSPTQSPTETGGAVLNEEKGLADTGSVGEDKAHEESASPSLAPSEAESFAEYEEKSQKVPPSTKELNPLERPVHNMTGDSQEASQPSHQDPQRDNKQLEDDFAELREEWKELGRALSNLRAKHEPVGQLGDQDIVDSTRKLRSNIVNLSRQRLAGWPSKRMPTGLQYLHYLRSTTPESSGYRALLNDPNRRSHIIEAFIWRVLVGEVFGGFHWAGEEIAPNISSLEKWLAETSKSNSTNRSDLQMWTSKTTELLLEALDARGHHWKQEASNRLHPFKSSIIDPIIETLGFPPNLKDSIAQQLDEIITGALDLDRDFSRQVVKWGWKYPSETDAGRGMDFDERSMSFEPEESLPQKKRQRVVKLAISPALVKCGDSDGENYDEETIVMSMVVSCKGF